MQGQSCVSSELSPQLSTPLQSSSLLIQDPLLHSNSSELQFGFSISGSKSSSESDSTSDSLSPSTISTPLSPSVLVVSATQSPALQTVFSGQSVSFAQDSISVSMQPKRAPLTTIEIKKRILPIYTKAATSRFCEDM